MKRRVRKIGRPAGVSREDTIERAIESARKLFTEKGYSGTTLKDISNDMGVSHSTLYLYFKSKADLYCQTIQVTQALLLSDYEVELASHLSCREKLFNIMRASLVDFDVKPNRSRFLAAVPVELMRHQELREAVGYKEDKLAIVLCQLFEQGLHSGEITVAASPEDLVVMCFGGLMGVSVFHQGGKLGSMEVIFELFVNALDHQIFKPIRQVDETTP